VLTNRRVRKVFMALSTALFDNPVASATSRKLAATGRQRVRAAAV
jgi:hypothetical protein